MLDRKPRNIWRPVRFGKDERDQLVTLSLLWNSVLVGAQPRKGKTFSARLLALHAALDPWVRLVIVDGKNSPGLEQVQAGRAPDRVRHPPQPQRRGPGGQPPRRAGRHPGPHQDRVNTQLAKLPVDVCPEGKLTEELARDPRYRDLRVMLLVMEEFQDYFETEDQAVNKEIAAKLLPHPGRRPVRRRHHPVQLAEALRGRRRGRRTPVQPVPGQPRRAVRAQVRQPRRVRGRARRRRLRRGLRRLRACRSGTSTGASGYLYGATDATPTVRTYLADPGTPRRSSPPPARYRERARHADRHGGRGGHDPRRPRRARRRAHRVPAPMTGVHWTDHRRTARRADAGALRRRHRRRHLRAAPRARRAQRATSTATAPVLKGAKAADDPQPPSPSERSTERNRIAGHDRSVR